MGNWISRPMHLTGTCHELGHTWNSSCLYSQVELFFFVLFEGVKLYLPLYLLSDIISRRPFREVVRNTLPNFLQSSLFLGVNGGAFIFFICLIRRLIGRFYFLTAAFIPGFLAATCAILVERKSRRKLLMGYCDTLAVEMVFSALKHRGYVLSLPYGEVMMFSFATAVLLHKYKSPAGLRDAVGSVFGGLLRPWQPAALTVFLSSFRGQPPSLLNGGPPALLSVAMIMVWSFAVGYLLQLAISLLSKGTAVLSDKEKAKRCFFNWYSVKFGAFLAALAGGFKALNSFLLLLPLTRDTRLLIAGALAGLSMCVIRSSSISLYVAGKALEVLYMAGVERGWLWSWYYGDVLLYALAVAILLHSVFFESHNLRMAYWKFLGKITRGRLFQLDYEALDFFGTQASTRIREVERSRHKEKQT